MRKDDLEQELRRLRRQYMRLQQMGVQADSLVTKGEEVKAELAKVHLHSIRDLRLADVELLETDLAELLLWACDQVNAKESMTDEQVLSLAADIAVDPEYASLTLEDIGACLRRGIKGKYSRILNRFDPPLVYEWLNTYKEERTSYFMEMQYRRHASRKESPHAPRSGEQDAQRFHEVQLDHYKNNVQSHDKGNLSGA